MFRLLFNQKIFRYAVFGEITEKPSEIYEKNPLCVLKNTLKQGEVTN